MKERKQEIFLMKNVSREERRQELIKEQFERSKKYYMRYDDEIIFCKTRKEIRELPYNAICCFFLLIIENINENADEFEKKDSEELLIRCYFNLKNTIEDKEELIDLLRYFQSDEEYADFKKVNEYISFCFSFDHLPNETFLYHPYPEDTFPPLEEELDGNWEERKEGIKLYLKGQS